MRRMHNNLKYPFFWGPAEHSLQAYYRRLNHLAFTLIPLMFLANEFLVRPKLAGYREIPNATWSIIALALNAQIRLDQYMTVFVVFVLYAACLGSIVLLLPKWGARPTEISMKSGLPPRNADYEHVYFWILNPVQKYAYIFWNLVFMPLNYFFSSFIVCMSVNLLRSF